MSLNKLVDWLNNFLIGCILIGLAGCNPYRQTIRINHAESDVEYMLNELDSNYPFSGHKDIDWHSYEPELQEHLSGNFKREDYLAIRDIIYSIPDARLSIISRQDKRLMHQELGAYAGFDLSRLADGFCRICKLDSASEAFRKGLRLGDKVLGWDGTPIHQAIEEKAVHWGIHPTNRVFRGILQDHFMTRGKAESSVELFYETATGNAKGIRVSFASTMLDLTPNILEIPYHTIKSSSFTTRESLGVWRIEEFSPQLEREFFSLVIDKLQNLKGLVIDLRQNSGGQDVIAVGLAQYFLTEEREYEETIVRDISKGSWLNIGHLHAVPIAESAFHKPVILLIGPLCNGVGEGFARIMQQEEQIQAMGMWSTAGSFSYPGGSFKLPGKFELHYPIGMSLDEFGSILIESTGEYGGGVFPDIHIPYDENSLVRINAGEDILLDEALAHLRRF